jgi:hypothetical protein
MNHFNDSQLNEYLDHALPAGMVRIMDDHFKSCDSCRTRLDELQLVFNRLEDLPEVRIPHDLAPNILSRLPQKNTRLWTPVFAAQVGAALGIILWLSSQTVRLIKLPVLPGFRFPQFTLSEVSTSFLTLDLHSLTINFLFKVPEIQFLTGFPIASLPYQFTLFHIPFWLNRLPEWHLPFSNYSMPVIIISSLLLWLFGNAILLRESLGVKK